jgi:hypothetical protein
VGARKGVVQIAASICVLCHRKSFHRLFTSRLFTDIMYVQAPHIPRRIALTPLEAVRSYPDLVISHGRARQRRFRPKELSLLDFARIGVLGSFDGLERLNLIEAV